mgnify:CR=1 FL=1
MTILIRTIENEEEGELFLTKKDIQSAANSNDILLRRRTAKRRYLYPTLVLNFSPS